MATAFAEIQWCSVDRANLTGRDEPVVHRSETVRADHHLVAQDVSAAGAGEVEIGVVAQVDMGRFVRRGAIFNAKLVVVGQGVGDGNIEPPRIPFLSVGARIAESELGAFGARLRLCLPELLVKARHSTMEVVSLVVPGEDIRSVVKGEGPIPDAIRISPDDRPEVWVSRQVPFEVAESKHDIGEIASAIGCRQRGDDATIGRDRHLHPVFVAQEVQVDVSSAGQGPERGLEDAVIQSGRTHRQV